MIRVAIADDHKIVVDGLVRMLQDEADIALTGTASDGGQLIALLQNASCNVVLLDIDMPGMNGIQACAHIRTNMPDTEVVALTMMTEPSIIRKMLEAGANGYLLKNTGKDELIRCIRTVRNGGSYYSQPVKEAILKSQEFRDDSDSNPYPSLSRREKQITRLIIDERTTQEIADELGIAFGTVETHRRNIMQKLGVRNVVGLVRLVLQYDLLGE